MKNKDLEKYMNERRDAWVVTDMSLSILYPKVTNGLSRLDIVGADPYRRVRDAVLLPWRRTTENFRLG